MELSLTVGSIRCYVNSCSAVLLPHSVDLRCCSFDPMCLFLILSPMKLLFEPELFLSIPLTPPDS
ncbi:hypothetical protein ERO13_A11G290300v2 [Gossypium hirsutum]|nr:hypothetical protein ERO13_A11G290300v2 [Gossypium hirsutum]